MSNGKYSQLPYIMSVCDNYRFLNYSSLNTKEPEKESNVCHYHLWR